MKTLLSLILIVLMVGGDTVGAQTRKLGKTEVLRPAPVAKIYRGPFNEEPKNVKIGNQTPLAGKKDSISYYDKASIGAGQYLELPSPIGPLVDENGDPILSGGGTPFSFTAYAQRFTTTLVNPRLDSIRVWFYVDSMESIKLSGTAELNKLEVGCVKERIVTGNDGEDRPFPDLGTTGSIGANYNANHKNIARASIASKIGTGELVSAKVSFAQLVLPEQNFIVYLNSRVYNGISQSEFEITTNAIRAIGDSIDIGSDFDDVINPEVHRTYRIALDEDLAYYTSSFAFYDNRSETGEFYAPNLYMIAYVRDPTAVEAVEDINLEGDALAQNYPNPFNPSTQIAYSLASGGQASLKVYNALGNEVATLFDGYRPAGKAEVNFDASELPTGTYYYTLKCGSFTSTKRMTLAK